MKSFLLASILILVHATVHSATLVGTWTDSTPPGPDYVPQYQAQCQVASNPVYENMALSTPNFTTTIADPGAAVLECRVRNVNIVAPSYPVEGNWTSWQSAAAARTPEDPPAVIFILVK